MYEKIKKEVAKKQVPASEVWRETDPMEFQKEKAKLLMHVDRNDATVGSDFRDLLTEAQLVRPPIAVIMSS